MRELNFFLQQFCTYFLGLNDRVSYETFIDFHLPLLQPMVKYDLILGLDIVLREDTNFHYIHSYFVDDNAYRFGNFVGRACYSPL